ncbi:hypothetical protein [Mucilaginibacter paludis]|nr:hypothetical protein [Mucilaginibacter paludis]
MNKKGLKYGSAHFWDVILNPLYCGKIEVAKHKDEERTIVPGSMKA